MRTILSAIEMADFSIIFSYNPEEKKKFWVEISEFGESIKTLQFRSFEVAQIECLNEIRKLLHQIENPLPEKVTIFKSEKSEKEVPNE